MILENTKKKSKKHPFYSRRVNFFFYLGFLSRTFTIHRTSGEGGAYLFDSSVTLPPALQTRRH